MFSGIEQFWSEGKMAVDNLKVGAHFAKNRSLSPCPALSLPCPALVAALALFAFCGLDPALDPALVAALLHALVCPGR